MSNSTSWDNQRAFWAVFEEGSLSAAARRLGVAQPTIRSRIAALEASLETTLFTRSANGLIPTDIARALVEPAKAMSLAHDVFVRTASAAPGKIAGTVRVSVSETMAIDVLPSVLTSLRESYPAIAVELNVTNKPADILRQEVDIAVRTFAPKQDALVGRKVGIVPLGFFASKDYLDRRGWPQAVSDLSDHDLIGPESSISNLEMGTAGASDLRPARFVLRTDFHPARIAAARAGLGITVMQVPIGLKEPKLARVLPDITYAKFEVWIVAHEDLAAVPKVRAVFDHLVLSLTKYIKGGRPARSDRPVD